MAKEKLFTPEDFDKDPKSPKRSHIKWIAGTLVAAIAIIAIIVCVKGCDSEEKYATELQQPSSVVEEKVNVTDTIVNEVSQPQQTEVEPADSLQEAAEGQTADDTAATTAPQTQNITDGEAEAMKVIRGVYGNYPERKNALGDNYMIIQNRVNELMQQRQY